MAKNGENKDEPKDIGITMKKSEDFSEWYQQVILKAEMIEYGPVSGCMIIRPYHHVGAGSSCPKCFRASQICRHDLDVRGSRQVSSERRAVHHEPKPVF